MNNKSQNRFALFFNGDEKTIRIGQFTRSQGGGGWQLNPDLVVSSWDSFIDNLPAIFAARFDALPYAHREKTEFSKNFFSKHCEVTAITLGDGTVTLIPIKRLKNGVSGIQATDEPFQASQRDVENVKACLLKAFQVLAEVKKGGNQQRA